MMRRSNQGFRAPMDATEEHAYESFQASQLYCPTCKRAMPVREQIALYLPHGAIYHYRCQQCHAVLGKKET